MKKDPLPWERTLLDLAERAGLDLEVIPVHLIAESTGNRAFLIIQISRLSLFLLTSQVFSIKLVSILERIQHFIGLPSVANHEASFKSKT